MEQPICAYPPELRTAVDRFSAWYMQKNPNRVLNWLRARGIIELQTTYTRAKRYQLQVNTFQAAILCLFNDGSEFITCGEIKQKTGMTDDDFIASMRQLCNPRYGVLGKQVNKPIFKDDEPINVKMEFKSSSVRVLLIPQRVVKRVNAEPTAEEAKEAKKVAKERVFVIQAHIVKVMKTQKKYSIQNLLTDVIRNIHLFKPEPKMIKEQIEVLIGQDYMKRDENNKAELIYIP